MKSLIGVEIMIKLKWKKKQHTLYFLKSIRDLPIKFDSAGGNCLLWWKAPHFLGVRILLFRLFASVSKVQWLARTPPSETGPSSQVQWKRSNTTETTGNNKALSLTHPNSELPLCPFVLLLFLSFLLFFFFSPACLKAE